MSKIAFCGYVIAIFSNTKCIELSSAKNYTTIKCAGITMKSLKEW
jgi:hypothetical protein